MSRRLTVVNNRVVVASMEARAALAEYDPTTERWTLRTNTQGGWLLKQTCSAAAVFKVPAPSVSASSPPMSAAASA